ncbi:MAG TPA: DUF3999 family protein [Candidatus Limnocylindrales bacterium]|nr:DUF3999 family protein [Candidatus Limnocylindrales bacterium]
MKRLDNFLANGILGCVFLAGFSAAGANLPSDWQYAQTLNIATTGLVKINLPVETLDAARPALEDLRLYDDAGNEVPYLIEQPIPSPKTVRSAKSIQVSLNANTTVIVLETGLAQPLGAVTLETPAMNFIKAVRVESSNDGKNWRILAQGRPIFRQPYGAANLKISFPPVVAPWLRLTVDDLRSQPVPFTGARVHAATGEPAPVETVLATITERDENPGETRLALDLGAANLDVASLQIETAEPLFTRQVSIAVPQISEDAIREQMIGQGVIYRVAIEGQPMSENLSVPLEDRVRSRELILFIKNGDSPPLSIKAVRIERRPVYLVFLARQPASFHLLTGNARCAVPRYDLAALGMNLKSVPVTVVQIPPPSDNPDYHPPEVLPGLEVTGASLDISEWKFRKPVTISGAGAQQVELDLDVLAHAQPGLSDLRVMRGSNQVPYLIQHTSISRSLALTVMATNDAKDTQLSRWIVKLPQANLPLTRLTCTSPTPLFERSLSLYEELADDRGGKYQHPLGDATWTRTPDSKSKEFTLSFDSAPQSDALFLETDNGDNPPIELEKFTAVYPATRMLFKAKADDELFLYYGNPRVSPPRYDLSLVAGQLLAADKRIASLSAEQQLKKPSWQEYEVPGKGGVLFWGILAVVVVVLLIIISRLLPKSSPPAK